MYTVWYFFILMSFLVMANLTNASIILDFLLFILFIVLSLIIVFDYLTFGKYALVNLRIISVVFFVLIDIFLFVCGVDFSFILRVKIILY
jgi:hypothetical protein